MSVQLIVKSSPSIIKIIKILKIMIPAGIENIQIIKISDYETTGALVR